MIEVIFREPVYIGGKILGSYKMPCVPRKGERVRGSWDSPYSEVAFVTYFLSENGHSQVLVSLE